MKKCKAKNHNGTKCQHDAVLEGYCIKHYNQSKKTSNCYDKTWKKDINEIKLTR